MTEVRCGTYKHYKGRLYEVIALARHSETLEEMVVYRALYDSEDFGEKAVWVRPKVMFLEHVIADGRNIPRFEFIG